MNSRSIFFASLVAFTFATEQYLPPLKGMQGFLITCDNEEKQSLVLQFEGHKNFDFVSISRHPSKNIQVLVAAVEVPDFKNFLETNGIEYKIYMKDLQKLIDKESKAQRARKIRRSLGPNGLYNFDHFPRLETINEYMIEISKKHKDVTLFSIGLSFEGRSMYGVKISREGNKTKPAILIDAGIHAREWIAPTTALYAISRLIKKKSQHAYENVDWYIIPQINPDGYEFSHTEYRMWRKTRSNTTNPDCVGVDGNRNFGYKWMFQETENNTGASLNPCENWYAGESAFSEMETQNLRDFILSKNGTIKAYISLHSTSRNTQHILIPWAYTTEIGDHSLFHVEIGRRAAKAAASVRMNNYPLGIASIVYYNAPGASMDWAMAVGGANLSYTIELPSEDFITSPKNINVIGLEIFRALKIFARTIEKND